MLKVLLIVPELHWQAGGDQALRLAAGLRARQCEVRVVTSEVLPASSPAQAQTSDHITTLDRPTLRDPRLLWRAWQRLRSFRADVVHTFQAAGNRHWRLLARLLTRGPIFSTSHVSADDVTPWQRCLRSRFHSARGKWIVPSETLARHWANLGVPANRVAVVPPCAASEEADLDVAALRTRLGLKPGLPVIACIGPLLRRTGFTDAVWALDVLRQAGTEAQLVLVGSGPERARIASFVRAVDVEDIVSFVGADLPLEGVLRIADLVWFPSIQEDSPDRLLTALAAGKPVIATQVLGLAEFITDGSTGILIPPGEQVLLSRHTLKLLEDAPLRTTLAQNARDQAHHSHPLANWIDQHLQLYRQALASH